MHTQKTKPPYLTKTRFKLARECPTKLFYTAKKELYPDNKLDDSFLESLANGGFQVGELAKYYYPGGYDVTSFREESLEETNKLLDQENVIIYEAAIRYKDLFIRADILIKKGKRIRLVEVKAKSCNGKGLDQFKGKRAPILGKWMPYLEDIAFQKYVTSNAFPDSIVTCSLMLADKTSECPTSGLNQKFRVVSDDKRYKGVKVSSTLNEHDLSTPMLIEVQVDELVQMIYNGEATKSPPDISFIDSIKEYAERYSKDEWFESPLSNFCKSCEFKCSVADEEAGKISGFKECWSKVNNLSESDLNDHLITELWFGNVKKLLDKQVNLIRDIQPEHIQEKEDLRKPGLSRTQRQWLQINKVINKDNTVDFDLDGINEEINNWNYPLHFIDFETSSVAIPFNEGRSPYEQIAFQFSHHVMDSDGIVKHIGEYLNTNPGEFPNYKFVRALKEQLENDGGTIFRYHNHENTILCVILRQLSTDKNAPDDKDALCDFIRTITHSTEDSVKKWQGERDMVDLHQMVLRYYYDPETKGSNSIKAILPSVLNRSGYLQNKYSKSVYQTGEVTSLNFPKEQIWVTKVDDRVSDPYKSLSPIFENVSMEQIDLISDDNEINEGGAALTAYGKLQFTEMSDIEREKLNESLLRYCELDTLAMVMIFEAWREWE